MASRRNREADQLTAAERREVAAEARVRCSGKLHRVVLTRGGAFCTPEHNGAETVIEAMTGKQCRCHQVRELWIEYCQFYGYGRPEKRLPKVLENPADRANSVFRFRERRNRDLENIDEALDFHRVLRELQDEHDDDPIDKGSHLRMAMKTRFKWRAEEIIQKRLQETTYKVPPLRRMEEAVTENNDNYSWRKNWIEYTGVCTRESLCLLDDGCTNARNISHIDRSIHVDYAPTELLQAHQTCKCLARQDDGTIIFVVGLYDQADLERCEIDLGEGEIAVVCGRQDNTHVAMPITTAHAVLRQAADGIWDVVRWLPDPSEIDEDDE